MNTNDTIKETRNGVFISYSRADIRYLKELHDQLALYVRNGQLNFWDDTQLVPGILWSEELSRAIHTARVAVFLVSAEFFASKFIARRELPPLLDAAKNGEVDIIPVILRPCPFRHSPLARFQAIHAVSKPICEMSVGKRNRVWVELTERIQSILDQPKLVNNRD